MSEPVIEVSNISKSYHISHQRSGAGYSTLKDDLSKFFKKPFSGLPDTDEIFWALKDINFTVNKGETFGIIGQNGSGKSTLLKILSRIVAPTTGHAVVRGKVASLLEVGTGFHPELTGRENIYFNGSMLGLSKQEITQKFDQIVEFSEIEKFLDTPVKFYSSGMYVRLAFSVAAHLDADVLILDEVLAVGDARFQKKSANKILSIAKEGRTILFVSHSAQSVLDICTNAILLKNGKIVKQGRAHEVIGEYAKETQDLTNKTDAKSNEKIRVKITSVSVTNLMGSPYIKALEPIKIKVVVDKNLKKYKTCKFVVGFYGKDSVPLFRIETDELDTSKLENGWAEIETGDLNITPTVCSVNLELSVDGSRSDYIKDATTFKINSFSTDVPIFNPELATIMTPIKLNFKASE